MDNFTLSSSSSLLEQLMLPLDDGLVFVIGCFFTVLSVVVTAVYFASRSPPVAMKKDEFQAFPLIEKEILSHDTRRFTFALQSPQHVLGLPIGQHIVLKFYDETEQKNHQRSYTPVSGNDTVGQVSFVIKVYKAGVHPKFPKGGKVSQHLDSLEIGDTMLMKGPKGHLTWLDTEKEGVKFTIQQMRKPLQTRHVTHLNMIAGGTGITPMLQVLQAIFHKDQRDTKTRVKMIYANQSQDDILVREELESLAKQYPDRFSLHYTIDRLEDKNKKSWKYSVGFVSKSMMQEHLFTDNNNNNIQTFMCGPPPMMKFACLPALQELNFTENDWFVF